MHAQKLIEVAGWISLHGKSLIDNCPVLPDDALSEYWIASRCRMDHWGRALRSLGQSESVTTDKLTGHAEPLLSLAEEILLSEVLARVVAAVAHTHDTHHKREEASPIGRNTLEAHREARSRLRSLIYTWWPGDSPKARHVHSLAKQAERWVDVLLAYVSRSGDVDHFAYDVSRLREFAYDVQLHGPASSEAAGQLLTFSLRASFAAANQPPVCSHLNRQIAGAALGLYGSEAFDSFGLLRPPWMIRAERSTDDAIALLDSLFVGDFTGQSNRLPERWRI